MSKFYVYGWIRRYHSPLSARLVFSYGGWSNRYSSEKQEIYHQHNKPIWHKGLLSDSKGKEENDTE